jgi:hypothetical protein
MVTKRRRVRRKPPVEEVEEEAVEEELEEEEGLDELEEEDLEADDDDWEEEEEEEEPPPKPKSKPKKVKPAPAKKPAAKKATPVESEDEAIEVKKVDTIIAEGVLTGLLDALEKGQSIVITKMTDNKWQLSSATAAVQAGPKLRGQEYWDEVLTQDYQEWHADWKTLTYAEKKKKAKSLKVKWEEHDDERIDNIRISAAVLAKLDIEKYNEDYQTRSARARLRGK